MSVVQGVRDAIIADTELTSKLAKYNFGSGEEPAVFTVDPAPEDAESPHIVITPVASSPGNARDRTHRGGETSVQVALYGNKKDSEKVLRNIADELWLTLDRASVQADGFDETVYCLANPPFKLNDPDGFPGYLVSCRVLVRTE